MYPAKLYDSRMRKLFICECLDGFFKLRFFLFDDVLSFLKPFATLTRRKKSATETTNNRADSTSATSILIGPFSALLRRVSESENPHGRLRRLPGVEQELSKAKSLNQKDIRQPQRREVSGEESCKLKLLRLM